MTVAYFLIALSILIIIHELGHFVVARLFGIRVEKFSVGFGPKLCGIKRGDTEYKLSVLPFGGYVKMSGDEPGEVDKNDPHAYYNKPVCARACVVAAGPVMNVILCFLLLPVVFMIGKSEPAFFYDSPQVVQIRAESPAAAVDLQEGDLIVSVANKDVKDWKDVIDEVIISPDQEVPISILRGADLIDKQIKVGMMPGANAGYLGVEPILYIGNEAVLDGVQGGSPADKAGLKSGDIVTKMNGEEIKDWTDMVALVGDSEGKPVAVTVVRDGSKMEFELTPEYNEEYGRYLMGVSKDVTKRDVPMVKVRHGFIESMELGFEEAARLGSMTFKVLGKLVSFKLSYKALGGPIKIAQVTAQAARTGLGSFIYLLAFLSMQLGILNLLPIPVLDGGHLVFFAIEAVRRKPLSERVMTVAQNIGLAALLFLIVIISINDMLDIEAVRNFIDKVF